MKKPRRFLVVIFISLMSAYGVALAEEECFDPQKHPDDNLCFRRKYEREDTKLNKNYKELTARSSAREKETLKEIQLVWIKFRTFECDYEASLYGSGLNRPAALAQCLIRMTKQRNEDFKHVIEDASILRR